MSTTAIAVITYRRPDSLRRLLQSLATLGSTPSWRILVVDNDPSGSARPVVDEFSLDIQYELEPTPGISAARNRCLDMLRPTDEAIAFVDDDEQVQPDWLTRLVDASNLYEADVVAGHVNSVLPPDTPHWIIRDGYFNRRVHKTGTSRGLPSTGNVLIRKNILQARPLVRFSPEYSLTGGSDSQFFKELLEGGIRWVWCAEAAVDEYVPRDRANFRWRWKRGIRTGNGIGRRAMDRRSRLYLAVYGAALAVGGAIAAPVTVVLLQKYRHANLILLTRGLGILQASLGKTVAEYGR